MLIRLNALPDWEKLIEQSKDRPVAILKTDRASAMSAVIFRLLKAALESGQLFIPVYWLTIQENRDIADQIAIDTGVKNETPQIIVIRSGHSVYHASHYAITIDNLKDALERNQ